MRIFAGIFVLFVFACSSPGQKATNVPVSAESDSTVLREHPGHWKVLGTEPFWNIRVEGDSILFTRLYEGIDSVQFRLQDWLSIDGGVSIRMIDPSGETADLNIVSSEPVSDGMSDKQYDHRALFRYRGIEWKGVAEKL